MSAVPANWDEIGKVVQMAKGYKKLIVGNGDVKNTADGREKAKTYGLDGIMAGRGIFLNPWMFNRNKIHSTAKERKDLLLKHLENFEKLFGNSRNFDTMKRFFKVYINDYPGAKELRTEMMESKNAEQARDILLKNSRLI
jgi:tRNA-dihydrouridine synthase